MPPKKAAPTAVAAPASKESTAPKRTVAKRKALEIEPPEQPTAKKAKAETSSTIAKKSAPTKNAAAPAASKKTVAATKERKIAPLKKAPATQKAPAAKITPAPKKAPLPTKVAAPKKDPTPKKDPAPRKAPAPKQAPAGKIALTQINTPPTQILDIYVFGEGTAGELGLGGVKYDGNKKPIDVPRPRINHKLSAKDVGVVQISVGGMHCAALTHDNKILTWGVNDTGALGRRTGAAKLKEIAPKDASDSDSEEDDDDDEYLNPTESEPREVNPKHFPEGTKFAFLATSDSATFAVTTEGLVYGWGVFRGNDGDLGFRPKVVHSEVEEEEYKDESAEERSKRLNKAVLFQRSPVLISELKRIVKIECGTNHALALDNKGHVFVWGAGEQNQLARRVVARTAEGALVPREFGLQRKKITKIGSGDYNSFAVDKDGKVYAWGLNTFSQTGIPTSENTNDTILVPTLVENLSAYNIKEIDGGAHHTISCTESGQVLVWGRIDNHQGGMEIDKFAESDVHTDEHQRRRYLKKPVALPITGETVSAFSDGNLVITKDGQAYSWGFSGNYQTGLGVTDDVVNATLIDNTAVRGKKLVFAGAGGQFGVLAAVHKD